MYSFLICTSTVFLLASIAFVWLWEREQDWWLPKLNFDGLDSTLPFDKILDDGVTIVCKDGTLAQVVSIKAIDYALFTKGKIAESEKHRQAWLDKMAQENAHIRIFTIRDQKLCTLDGEFPNEILERMHTTWMNGFKSVYYNRHYIVLSVPAKQSLLNFKKISFKQSKLNKLVEITEDLLSGFEPVVLQQDKFSPLLSFLARLAIFQDVSVARGSDISKSISSSNLLFGNDGVIKVDDNYVRAVSVNTWGEICDRAILDEILRLDSELIVFHNLQGHSTVKCMLPTMGSLVHSAGQARMCIGGNEIEAEYLEAIEEIKTGKKTMYEYQLTVFVANKDKQKCLETINKIKNVFTDKGITPIKATKTLKYLYLSMFPSNDAQLYPAKLLSDVLSHWIALAGEAQGLTKSDWGDYPLWYYKTANGGAYPFQLHSSAEKEEVGHSVTIAPTGDGKTTIWEHIIIAAIRLGVICYVFDRLNGTKVFTNAVGGEYVALENKLNPLCCEDTPQNRAFIHQLLLMMAGCKDKESQEQATKAIKNIFGLPMKARTLTNIIHECFAQSDLKKGLEFWTGNNIFGHWFNGVDSNGDAFDALDTSASHLVSFDMTEIQKHPLVAACVQHYVMHRIRQELQGKGQPHLIFIDEASPQLQNADFREQVKIMLREHRKLRGSVNLCFQSAESVLESGIGNIINEQCPTKIIFSNPKADIKTYDWLNLSDHEKDYVQGKLPFQEKRSIKRSILVKKKDESIILNINMDGMGDLLKLYKSGSEKVKLAEELKQQYGHIKWVEHYLER